MNCSSIARLGSILVLVSIMPRSEAQIWQLETSQLRLLVNAHEGYHWDLVNKATGQVLLDQNQTRMSGAIVTGIENVSTTGNSLRGLLSLEGGQQAEVSFQFTQTDVLQVTLGGVGDFRPSRISERFDDDGERYYGVWEAPYGNSVLNNDQLSHSFYGHDTLEDDVYAASARAPFYMTSTGVGVYAETTARGQYDFGNNGNTGFEFETSSLSYHIMAGGDGRYKRILERYNGLAGPSFRPPDWAFGTIWWRNDHNIIPSYTEAANAQELVIADADILRAHQIPATVMWIDRPWTTGSWGWGGDDFAGGFPDPDQMVRDLNLRGMKLLAWIANRAANDLLAGAPAGAQLDDGNSGLDVRDPAVYQHFQNYLNGLMDQALLADGSTGLVGYKIDRGGEGGLAGLQNEFVPLFNELAYEGMAQRNGSDFFIFSRSVNDTSRQYSAHWNGDPRPTWQGLATSVVNVIRSGLINQPMWGSDTGGFSGAPSRELFARWIGFSAYTPMMEIKFDQGRERAFYDGSDPELVTLMRKHATEHHLMIPYARSLMDENIRTGLPPVRAMLVEFPDDPGVVDMAHQYMYGSNLLVAPVLEDGARRRMVYFPAGEWIDYNDRQNRFNSGGDLMLVDALLDEIPTFVLAGAILPRGDIVRGNNDWTPDWQPWLNIEVYLPSVTDASSSFDYFTGTDTRPVLLNKAADGVIVSFDDLLLDGSLVLYLDEQSETKLLDEEWHVFLNGQQLHDGQFDLTDGVLTTAYHGGTDLEIRVFSMLSAGDFDGDRDVDGDDFLIWQASFGVDTGGDADNDGDTDGNDFLIWQSQFSSGSGSASMAVPEPTSIVLLFMTLASAAISARRKVQTSAESTVCDNAQC